VLEVGGGTGGTTGFALEALAPFGDRVAYTFTDIGPSFLVAARRRFADTPGFQAKLLDAARPAVDQGFEEGSADVVLAANVVHATPRIADTLGHLGKLLAPDGVLVLKEATGLHAVNTLTFGLTAEWWSYSDPEARMPGGPLLSRTGWRAALTAAGYSGVGIAGLPGDTDGTGAESVIVAAAPKGARAAASAPARTAEPAPSGKADGEIERKLIAAVAEALHLAPDEIDLAASFADYGADSIISVELVRKINESFGIELKTTALFNFATVRDLARYIALEFGEQAAPEEAAVEDAVAVRVGAAKARTSRLRDMIDKRRTAAPVNAEADFLAREAEKARAHKDPDRPGAMSMETLLKRLEAGEIALEDAYETEVSDDA
jgi:acyl carrier protein